MKKIILGFIVLVVSVTLFAAPPASYYTNANGKTSDALRTALSNIIGGHTVVSYDNLKTLYIYSDTKNTESDAGTSLIDIYSTCTFEPGSGYCGTGGCGGYNREHSVPKSWFNEGTPMYSDAFHLYPTSCYVNSYRGNLALGVCTSGVKCTTNGMTEALGRRGNCTYPGYSSVVYEPDDEYKGDLARSYFYMATRYADQCSGWSGGMFGSNNNGFQTWAINMLLEWHRQDPVSEKERIRNEAIYGNTTYNKGSYKQNNRNPFIDYPCLAEYIWGNKKGTNVDFTQILSTYSADYATTNDLSGCSCAASVPALIAPTNGSSLVVGAAGKNETVTAQLTVKGVLLTKSLLLAVSGTNASLFTVLPTTVTSTNALAGTTVTVSYKPTALGNHTATLTISSSTELAQSTTVTLTGSCSASLVSPTTSGLVFSSDNVMVKNDQTVLVKGTNLSSTVGLSITGTNAALFKVSSASVTAADANAGKNITVSYTPTTVGSHTATLVVTSSDFTTVNVPLTGTCTFQALEATNVTKNAFNANWTNAGVTNYVLDVFKQQVTGAQEIPVFEDPCNKSTTATVGGGVYYDIDGCVRLGSSSKVGSLTYAGLDLSAGGSVVVNAYYYGSDAGTQMKVTVGSVSQTFDLTATANDYTLSFEANSANTSASVVIESLASSKRINVNNVQVSIGGETITNTSLTGYPKSVGNVQSYLVVGLEPNTQYYYTVTPTGVPVSEQIAVMTLEENTPTSMQYTDANALVYYTTSEAIHILNLQPGSAVNVFDATGRLCAQRLQCAAEEAFVLPEGVYVFKVSVDGVVKSVKVVR